MKTLKPDKLFSVLHENPTNYYLTNYLVFYMKTLLLSDKLFSVLHENPTLLSDKLFSVLHENPTII